jgi:hypothetical protein
LTFDNLLIYILIVLISSLISVLVTRYYENKNKKRQKEEYEKIIQEIQKSLTAKQTKAYQVGINQANGSLVQLLGTIGLFFKDKYDYLLFFSNPTSQPSFDLLGISLSACSIDFIEIKKRGSSLTQHENKLKELILKCPKINYLVFDVDIPETVSISQRDRSD